MIKKEEIDKIKKKIDELKASVELLERKGHKTWELYLRIGCPSRHLIVAYNDGENENIIGFIHNSGKCCFTDTDASIANYELWREHGCMLAEDTETEWRGGEYSISHALKLSRLDIVCGGIYNLMECVAVPGCEDENIIRHKHNERPILF